jgi:hypothetical protein
MLATCVVAGALASGQGGPQVSARTPLSALPPALAVGSAGPFNRIAFDVDRFATQGTAAQVTCIYPGKFQYRCDAAIGDPEPGSARRRVTVTIPDLGRGSPVVVRFGTASGSQDSIVKLANAPQVVHEIEALALPGGGQAVVGSDGAPTPVMSVVSERMTTTPAMAAAAPASPGCDQLYAEWVGASATDPVFQSAFGPLNGSVLPSRPVKAGSRVRGDNLPEWLVTFPLGATRVQFIAHYEVLHRVGTCPRKVIAPG